MLTNYSFVAPPISKRVLNAVALLGRLIVANSLFIAVTAVYFAAYQVFVAPLENVQSSEFWVLAAELASKVLLPMLFVLLVSRAYVVARYRKPAHPILAIAVEVWRFVSDRNRFLLGIPVMAIMLLFQKVYVEFKVNIPLIAPFSWDEWFYELDKSVHFGVDPWQLVHPFFQLSDHLVLALNFNYSMWFLFMWAIFIAYAFSRSISVGRTRFLLAFFLAWSVGGSLLAIVFSSAGPAFFTDLGFAYDPYAPLMRHLTELDLTSPLSAIDLQRTLWDGYANQGHNYGISAMPSMHNAVALLLVLGTWRTNRVAGILLSIHAFLIYIGSFYLGWHYAVDAYLGWAVALAMWWVSGPIANWWHRLSVVEALAVATHVGRVNQRSEQS